MWQLRRPAPVVLICCFAAATAIADDPQARAPQPVAIGSAAIQPGGPPGSGRLPPEATAGVPDIPENRAEIEALHRGGMTLDPMAKSAPESALDVAREARRTAFAAVVATQDARIRSLTNRLASMPGSPGDLEIQKEIEHEKLATVRLLLELQLDFATLDGDQSRIDRVKAGLDAWDAPRPVLQPIDRPAPSSLDR